MRLEALVAAVAFCLGAAGSVGAATDWALGSSPTTVFRPSDGQSLELTGSTASLDAGGRLVAQGTDGNFELEHGAAQGASLLTAETLDGTPTPLQFGAADGQDVTALVVPAEAGLAGDLQQWGSAASIDASGRLRLHGIVLYAATRNGQSVLMAELPDGSTQVLQPSG